jgi:hypothetical protein
MRAENIQRIRIIQYGIELSAHSGTIDPMRTTIMLTAWTTAHRIEELMTLELAAQGERTSQFALLSMTQLLEPVTLRGSRPRWARPGDAQRPAPRAFRPRPRPAAAEPARRALLRDQHDGRRAAGAPPRAIRRPAAYDALFEELTVGFLARSRRRSTS